MAAIRTVVPFIPALNSMDLTRYKLFLVKDGSTRAIIASAVLCNCTILASTTRKLTVGPDMALIGVLVVRSTMVLGRLPLRGGKVRVAIAVEAHGVRGKGPVEVGGSCFFTH